MAVVLSFLTISAHALSECRGVETDAAEFRKLLSNDAKVLKTILPQNAETENCNRILANENPDSSDSHKVLSLIPPKYSAQIKNSVEMAKKRGIGFSQAIHFETSLVKCYCDQRGRKLTKAQIALPKYGYPPGNACLNLAETQKIFRNGFKRDSALKSTSEEEQESCRSLSGKDSASESDVGRFLTSIPNSFAEYIKKEVANTDPGSRTAHIWGIALCYCLERSLEK